ncbi:hypothetical protein LCGC14_0836020 [marine sediment metagenome]|uniref:Uncharacterized protein n=1 Tax=marine sediment metagenome TaxID=412755 RepID=A0A0F9PZW3_9ZZZZ
MSKLSRREFLKIAAALTSSGALAWVADTSPIISVKKVVEGGNILTEWPQRSRFAGRLYEAREGGDIHLSTDQGDTWTEILVGSNDDSVLQEQPFLPYYLDPYSSRVEVPFYK